MQTIRKILAMVLVLSVFLSMGATALADADAPVEDIPAEETLTAEETPGEETLPAEETAPAEADEPADPETESPEPAEDTAPYEPAEDTAPYESAEEIESEPAGDTDETAEEPASPESEESSEEPEETEPAAERPWTEPGNTDAEILGGGYFLNDGGTLYYFDGGLWAEANGSTRYLCGDEGMNLNLADGWLYYTVDGDVRRLPSSGGSTETVYSFGATIRQMYVMGSELRFVSGGEVWSYDMETAELSAVDSPAGVLGLIPTMYGNLFLTGSVLDYTLWVGTEIVRSGVEQCWTDSGFLALVVNGQTLQVLLEDLFLGSYALETYAIHEDEETGNGLTDEEQLANEAAFLTSETYAVMQDALSAPVDGAYTSSNSKIASTAYTSSSLTTNQKNMVLRSRQMAEVRWTPLAWRYSWGGDNNTYINNNSTGSRVTSVSGTVTTGYFRGGETYQGIPYAQAVYTGYVGWDISIDGFVNAVNNTSSKFYSGYSTYSRTAPYYGSDCSGFVSWAWQLPYRCTCTSMLSFSTRITNSLQNLRIGDSLNNPNSHVVIITNIGYDASGNVNSVEITEQTPCKMRVTCYGELLPGKTYEYTGSLSYIQSYYFNGGYSIYRRNYSGSVSFTTSSAVNLEESGYAAAPLISMTINETGTAKVVQLLHSNSKAVIYYTTDGSTPTKSSKKYTGPFEVTRDTTVKAIADCGSPYTGSYTLSYDVKVDKAEKPFIVLIEGDLQDDVVSYGSKITVQNTANDTIYYTTDGSTPTKLSTKMTDAGVTITRAMTFKAIAVSESNLNSDVAEITVTIGTFHTITAAESNGGYITPSGKTGVLEGSDYTFTINPLQYFEIEDVVVDGRSVGAVTSYKFTNVTTEHTISATYAVKLPFSDVSNRWYTGSVGFVYSKGLFSGTSTSTFSPTSNMTRAMFVTVLGRFAGNGQWKDLEGWSGCLGITNGSKISVRTTTTTSDVSYVKTLTGATGQHIKVLGVINSGIDGAVWYHVNVSGTDGYMRSKTTGSNPKTLLYYYTGNFSDLANGTYYTGYAQWAYIYSIVNGVSSTSFQPNASITRQDICVMLYRYLTYYCGKTLSTAKGTKFTDDSSISSYASNAVYAMQNIGVVNGYTDGSFKPKGYATRAEVATMFERLYEYLYG